MPARRWARCFGGGVGNDMEETGEGRNGVEAGPRARSATVGPQIDWKRHRLMTGLLNTGNALVTHAGIKRVVRPLYAAWRAYRDSGVLAKNEALRNLYSGRRCFVLGLGPSLAEVDFGRLAPETTFGCSFLFKHEHLAKLDVSFYCDVEPPWSFPFSALRASEYYAAIDRYCVNAQTRFLMRADNRAFFERSRIFRGRPVYYVQSAGSMLSAKEQRNDLTGPITFMDGVVFFMIAAAVYMGFAEVYLAGCGYTYSPIQEGHFWRGWDMRQNKPVDPRHRLMREFAERQGARVYNIVPDGFESPVYEKVSWERVVASVLCGEGRQT